MRSAIVFAMRPPAASRKSFEFGGERGGKEEWASERVSERASELIYIWPAFGRVAKTPGK